MTAPLVIHELPNGFYHSGGGFLDLTERGELASRPRLARCPKCNRVTSTNPHAPHLVGRTLVDCQQKPITNRSTT